MHVAKNMDPEDSGVSPLWKSTAPPLATFDTLKGEQEADIAIVGAGIAGLSVATISASQGSKSACWRLRNRE